MGEHSFGRAVVGDASIGTEHDDAVHMLRPHAHPVFDDDQGGTGYRDRLHHGIAHLLNAFGVEVRGGFVKQNGARVHRQDSGEPQALFLPARKLADLPLCEVLDIYPLHCLLHFLFINGFRNT